MGFFGVKVIDKNIISYNTENRIDINGHIYTIKRVVSVAIGQHDGNECFVIGVLDSDDTTIVTSYFRTDTYNLSLIFNGGD